MAEDLLADYRREVADLKRERDDLKKALDKREDENKTYRDSIKALEAERNDLKAKLPADGSVILGKADGERWAAYQALGKVDEVKVKLGRVNELESTHTKREREDGLKAKGLKPSIFELIAEGKPYRVDGEGDDRKIYLTVDDKDVELSAYAQERGLDDLLGVMGLESKPAEQTPPPYTGPGKRQSTSVKRTEQEIAAQKQSDPTYSI